MRDNPGRPPCTGEKKDSSMLTVGLNLLHERRAGTPWSPPGPPAPCCPAATLVVRARPGHPPGRPGPRCCRHGNGGDGPHRLRGQRRVSPGVSAAVCLYGLRSTPSTSWVRPEPQVGLLNIGAEDYQGHAVCRLEAYRHAAGGEQAQGLLQLRGQCRGKRCPPGRRWTSSCADGFSGNILPQEHRGDRQCI